MTQRSRIATLAGFVAYWLVGTATVAFASTPSPDVLSPHPNQTITTGPVTAIGIGLDNALVEVWEDDDVVGSGFAEADGIFQFTIATGGFGSHTIRARQLGPDLSWSPFSAPITFTTDIAPVQPRYTAPSPGAALSQRPVTVSGTADSGSTITIKKGSTTLVSGIPVTARRWSTQINLADGQHTLTATATDAKGRASPGSTITFTIDTVAPSAPSIASPASGAVLGSTTVTVSGTAERSASVSVYEGATLRGTTTASASSGAWSLNATFGTGSRCITARATDAAGNQGPSSTQRCFVVDTAAPSVSIATPNNSVFLPGPAVIIGTASDNHGLSRVELSYAPATGSATNRSATGTTSWSDDAGSLAAGVYTLSAVAVDLAGNRSAPASIKIVIL